MDERLRGVAIGYGRRTTGAVTHNVKANGGAGGGVAQISVPWH